MARRVIIRCDSMAAFYYEKTLHGRPYLKLSAVGFWRDDLGHFHDYEIAKEDFQKDSGPNAVESHVSVWPGVLFPSDLAREQWKPAKEWTPWHISRGS